MARDATKNASTDIPQLPPEPPDELEEPDAGAEAPRRGRRRREPSISELGDVADEQRSRSEQVTQEQLVKAFYWLYRGFCRLLASPVDAHQTDFEDLGRAWIDLAKKVPGIKVVLLFAGPVFTLTDLVDKLARAWEVRQRFRSPIRRPSWRQRAQDGAETESDDAIRVHGGTGAA